MARTILLLLTALGLVAGACQSPAAQPTAAPTAAKPAAEPAKPTAAPAAKPAEAAKPAAEPAKPAASPQAAAPAPKTAAAPAKAGLETISFGLVSRTSWYMAIYIAQEKGFFREAGVNVEDKGILQSSALAMQALAGGSLDIAPISVDNVINAVEKGTDVKIVAGGLQKAAYELVVKPEIARVEDLKGKIIGASALKTGEINFLRRILEAHGLKEGDYTVIVAGGLGERAAGMDKGAFQATVLTEPYVSQLVDKGMKRLDSAIKLYPNGDFQYLGIAARGSWLREKPDTAVKFLSAYIRAATWMYDPKNKDETIKITMAATNMDEKTARRGYEYLVEEEKALTRDGRNNMPGIKAFIDDMVYIGQLERATPAEKYVDNTFVEKAAALK